MILQDATAGYGLLVSLAIGPQIIVFLHERAHARVAQVVTDDVVIILGTKPKRRLPNRFSRWVGLPEVPICYRWWWFVGGRVGHGPVRDSYGWRQIFAAGIRSSRRCLIVTALLSLTLSMLPATPVMRMFFGFTIGLTVVALCAYVQAACRIKPGRLWSKEGNDGWNVHRLKVDRSFQPIGGPSREDIERELRASRP